jgi:hypothetical protein
VVSAVTFGSRVENESEPVAVYVNLVQYLYGKDIVLSSQFSVLSQAVKSSRIIIISNTKL